MTLFTAFYYTNAMLSLLVLWTFTTLHSSSSYSYSPLPPIHTSYFTKSSSHYKPQRQRQRQRPCSYDTFHSLSNTSSSSSPSSLPPYCNVSLPIPTRITNLLSLLTPREKISLLGNDSPEIIHRWNNNNDNNNNNIVHLPPYKWWNEALHGLAETCCPTIRYRATSFPQVCSLGASFNRSMFHDIGVAIGDEIIERYRTTATAAAAGGDDDDDDDDDDDNNTGQMGLDFWTPNINIFRDPRWGRGQEVPSEDPFVNGEYASRVVRGLQFGRYDDDDDDDDDDDAKGGSTSTTDDNTKDTDGGSSLRSRPPRIAATCKHFAAYNLETDRFTFDAHIIDRRDWDDTYLPAFYKCVTRGKAMGIMCSYNAIDGVPSCANRNLLTTTLRQEWKFDGYVTGDCGAVENIYTMHKYASSPEEAVKAALQAGVDVDCGNFIQRHGMDALNKGVITTDDVDRALRNLFMVQFRLGYFDPSSPTHSHSSVRDIDAWQKTWEQRGQRHDELALEAARQGIVLLKNGHEDDSSRHDDDAAAAAAAAATKGCIKPLPLSEHRHKSVALFGPNANATTTMQGNYEGIAPFLISPKDGLESLGVNVEYHPGCTISGGLIGNSSRLCHSAQISDVTVLVVGLDQTVERETLDRTSLTLPGSQHELIDLVGGCAKRKSADDNDAHNVVASTPVILIIMSGGPVDLTPYKSSTNIDAILYVGYPGQAGGLAIAELLYGKFNPSGRLSTTIYPADFVNEVDLRDMSMRPGRNNPGRTYRFYTGKAVYPFGYGLSYSTFQYRIVESNRFRLVIEVHNAGPMDGAHSILLFHEGPDAGMRGNPIKSLIDFDKVWVKVGMTRTVSFEINPELMSTVGLHRFIFGPTDEYVSEISVESPAILG